MSLHPLQNLVPVLSVILSATAAADVFDQPSSWILSADHPAKSWTNGYPVGNGSMGGLNLGAFPNETIVLNHDTIWSPHPHNALKPGERKQDMDEAFALALKGDYAAAQAAYCKAKNRGNGVATFQTLGALAIEHEQPTGKPSTISRKLDLMTGESVVTTTLDDGAVRETLVASYPDQCVVIRLESTRPGGLQCKFKLDRPAGVTSRFARDGTLGFDGSTGEGGTKFAARAKVVSDGGAVTQDGDTLRLQGGKSATIFITSATDYNRDEPRAPRPGNWADDAETGMKKIVAAGWEKVRARAVEDHRGLMSRCGIDLGQTAPEIAALTTPERMEKFRNGGADPDLIETFFQFGRHLLISSSRPGSLPPNLQGLWEGGLSAAWNGDFHLNINVQMNLWPANATGLGDCNEPFFALLKLLHKHGAETAASLGCKGYAAGLASDGWGNSDWCGGSAEWDSYILGGHWAQEHLMEHSRFTGDKTFLRETAWPILKDGSIFLLDWMKDDSANGQLIGGPGSSPENAFRYTNPVGKTATANVAIGNTHDHEIAWETFSDTMEAAKILGIRDDFTAQVAKALNRVPAPSVGTDGRIMEWNKPFGEVWPGHRHKSHLYGLYPGHQITRSGTPALATAAEASLTTRMALGNGDTGGGGHTGWNLAWSTNLWARLGRGDQALAMIREQLRTQVNENLFNRCGGPFQVDGNLGTPAGIAEMLIQSHELTADGKPLLRLLPALPGEWKTGQAIGLRARGGYIVDMQWQDGKVTRYHITSPQPASVSAVINGETRVVKTESAR